MRKAALSTNQGHEAIMQGVSTLVAQGMSATEAGQYASLLGKTATATGAELNDFGQDDVFSSRTTWGSRAEANLKEALNRAAYGAKLGQFDAESHVAVPAHSGQHICSQGHQRAGSPDTDHRQLWRSGVVHRERTARQ